MHIITITRHDGVPSFSSTQCNMHIDPVVMAGDRTDETNVHKANTVLG